MNLNEPFMHTRHVKELYLSYIRPIDDIESFQRILTFKFKLENLIISETLYPTTVCSELSQLNLSYFLKSQSKSIKQLTIQEWMGPEVLKTIFKDLEILEDLTLEKIEHCGETVYWKKLKFTPNRSIIFLTYQDKKENSDLFNAVVEAVINLKFLNLYLLTQVMLDNSMYKLANLEYLSISMLGIREVRDWNMLLKLEIFTCYVYDLRLLSNLESKTIEQRSYFENILFDHLDGRISERVSGNFVL